MYWRRKWQPTPVFLPGESQGQGSLVGYHLWGRTESDTTERLHFHFSFSCTGEGNGNPCQYSCLENPRDRGAWQATIHRVTKSWTVLKQLSMHTYAITGILFIVYLLFLQSFLLLSSLPFFLCGLMTLAVCLDSFLSLLYTYYRFLLCDYHGAYI